MPGTSAAAGRPFTGPQPPPAKKFGHANLPLISDSTPVKKPRLSSAEGSSSGTGAPVPISHLRSSSPRPVIIGEPVSLGLGVPSNQSQSSSSTSEHVSDPLDEASADYGAGEEEEEGDIEEGIDFNNLKTEPIQVYGYEHQGGNSQLSQSEMLQDEDDIGDEGK